MSMKITDWPDVRKHFPQDPKNQKLEVKLSKSSKNIKTLFWPTNLFKVLQKCVRQIFIRTCINYKHQRARIYYIKGCT